MLDTSVFGPFNKYLDKAIVHYTNNAPNTAVDYGTFSTLCKDPWIKATSATNLINGFAGTGIWPCNQDKVLAKIPKFHTTSPIIPSLPLTSSCIPLLSVSAFIPPLATQTSIPPLATLTSIQPLATSTSIPPLTSLPISSSPTLASLYHLFTIPTQHEHDNCTCGKTCPIHESQALVVSGTKKRKSTLPKRAELLTAPELRARLVEQEQKKKNDAEAKEQRTIMRKEKQIANIIKKHQQQERGAIRRLNAAKKKEEKAEKPNKRQKVYQLPSSNPSESSSFTNQPTSPHLVPV